MEEKMETNHDEEEKAIPVTVLELSEELSEVDGSVIIGELTTGTEVIIEELKESEVVNVNMTEFVDTEAVKIHHVDEHEMTMEDLQLGLSDEEEEEEGDDDNDILTPDEEDRLTKQFLNGELTFSEYSSRMDRSIDIDLEDKEIPEEESPREIAEVEETRKTQPILREDSPKPRKRAKNRKKRRILPLALQGLMGEANLRFAKGATDVAIKMCMEIIRQVPSAPEPYQTLATIYEADDPEKALQFSLIGAHLSPKDADNWRKLAMMSIDSNNIKQALTCYAKAIQSDPKDVTLYEERARLQEQIGEKRAFLKGYMKLIHHLGPEEGEDLLKYAILLAKKYTEDNDYDKVLECMEQIFEKCPHLITLVEVNLMAEVLIAKKSFHQCLEILVKYTNLQVKYKDQNNDIGDDKNLDERVIESCEIPDDLPVDIKVKFMVTLIELNYVELVDSWFHTILDHENPVSAGDVFLDIAEALMSKKEFKRALRFLDPLVNVQNYSLPAVWLRYAECLAACKQFKNAMLAYEIVNKLSPDHLGVKLQLSVLYKCFGFKVLAIDILKQDPKKEELHPETLYRIAMIHFENEDFEEFIESGLLLLSRHCLSLRSKNELSTLMRPSVRQRREALQLHRLSRAEPLEDENVPVFANSTEPSFNDEFNLFIKLCKVAYKLKKFGLLQRLCFTTLTSKIFEPKTAHIIFLCLLSCIYNNDSYYGYNLVRDLVRDCRKSNLWNLLNIIIQRADDSRHNRFIMRLLSREDAFSYLHVLHANNCLVSGTYKYALSDYVSLFKVRPSPLLALLIGVTFLQMACQKYAAQKHRLVTQAFAFFKKYAQIRGPEMKQESNFNIARALHQLGLVSGAVHFYKLVLNSPVSDLVTKNSERLDLKQEAAFNLHLVYMQSGNPYLARMYLEEYIVV